MKHQVTLVQTKTLLVDIDAKDADDAVREAKQAAMLQHLFEPRIGAIQCADVRAVEATDSND